MAAIEFYTNPMSRGQIARWMLHEAGLDYDERLVGYGSEMGTDAYRAVNPMRKVPAIRHEGRVVTEVAAICAYLAEVAPEAGLAPRGPEEAAPYYRWLFFAAGPVEAGVVANAMGWKPTAEQERAVGFGSYERVVDVLDGFLSGTQYVCGERFTAADVYLGSQVVWGMQFHTLPNRDSFSAYAARLTAREAYEGARARDDALIAQARAPEA